MLLENPLIPYDNNDFKRAIRNPVLYIKIICGFRIDEVVEIYYMLVSIMEITRRQGNDIFEKLTLLISKNQPF